MEIAKNGYICAQDVIHYVATPKIQEKLSSKSHMISVQTTQRWLKWLNWQYDKKQNGMYVNGHEREDVVQYWKEFIARWKDYEKRMVTYDKDGNINFIPTGFPILQGHHFWLILVTHNESTFYANDWRKTQYYHTSEKATLQKKGEGPSLMISDMLTSE